MELLKQRKGITPVIAIVLLLMVTVGAVGVVYTQFNSLVGNPQQQFEEQQRDQNTRISITNIEANGTIGNDVANPSDDITMMLTITNSGSVARNSSDFLLTVSGTDADVDGDCFAGNQIIGQGQTYTCNTGVPFPGVTEETTLEVRLTGTSKTWTETCTVTTTGAETC